MRKSSLFLIFFFFVGILNVTAQNTSINFSSSVERLNDSTAQLNIHAIMSKGVELFSTKKTNPDDAFISTFAIDSSLKKYTRVTDSITESGKLQTLSDTALQATLHFFTDSVTFKIPLHIPVTEEATIQGKLTWLAKKGNDYPSGEKNIIEPLKKGTPATSIQSASKTASGTSLWGIFIGGLLAGLIAVFTPCVFPLIPVTVSFFLKRSKNRIEGIRNAMVYSLSIIFIYTIPTFILTKLFGPQIMYKIATSVTANLLFFAIFIIFALSFFGAFELTLPSSWANKTDKQAGKGGVIGTFFMALTLVIVSFSCTGPFVGTALGQLSSTGEVLPPVIGILGLSAGLAIPFTLFAVFPSMLHSLPKSGGWLNSVKVVFGFIELALAFKFLSMVDLIYGWHLLDREIFLAIWIVLAVLMGFYILGKIKLSHDSEVKYVSIPRLFFAIIAFTFAIYLLPGMWGAPLKAMSGLLPPPSTQDFDLNQLQYKIENISNAGSVNNAGTSKAIPPKLYTDKLHMPLGLTGYFDFDEGMAAAKALNKPVMLDFTGHSCANCRKMENEVWSNPDVLKMLKNDFVIISLYVDEPSTLPVSQQYKTANGKYISTLGDKNLDYEQTKFGLNSQPLYMFLDLKGNPLSDVRYGYDSNIQKFIQHLNDVKQKFEAEKK